MPPHNHVYKPPSAQAPPPPPPPPTQQQRSRGGSIGNQHAAPQQTQNYPIPPRKPTLVSGNKENDNAHNLAPLPPRPQAPFSTQQKGTNPPPVIKVPAPLPPLRKPVASPNILSPVTSAPSTPIGSPGPILPARPSRDLPTNRAMSPFSRGRDLPPPTPPRLGSSSTPTRPPARVITARHVASPSPLGTSSPSVFSPVATHSPLRTASPMKPHTANVMSPPSIMSPPHPPPRIQQNPLKATMEVGDNTNYDSGNEERTQNLRKAREVLVVLRTPAVAATADAKTPTSGASTPPVNLKSSVGILRDEEAYNSDSGCGDNTTTTKKKVFLLKSPKIKNFLLEQLGSQSAHNSPVMKRAKSPSTPRRSRTPPPMRTTPDSPSRPRKLSEPVPIKYNHLARKAELLGSHDGISMPYNVTHTTHINETNFGLLVKNENQLLLSQSNIPLYDKCGYLHKLAGLLFKERWFECRQSILFYYSKKGDTKPRGEIFLVDCEFQRDKTNKRLYTIHLTHVPTKKQYYISAKSSEEMEDWVRALHGSGAVDVDFVQHEKDVKERQKKEEEARKARSFRKKEDAYVKAKFTKRSTLKLTNKNMTDCAIRDCACAMIVSDAQMKDQGRGMVFKIDITFDDQHWTIFRKYDKVVGLYNSVYKLKVVKGLCPPKKAPSNMSEDNFTKMQMSKMQEFVNALIKYRACVLGTASAKQAFLRFIAPVGWDDVKSEQFIMPFAFDF